MKRSIPSSSKNRHTVIVVILLLVAFNLCAFSGTLGISVALEGRSSDNFNGRVDSKNGGLPAAAAAGTDRELRMLTRKANRGRNETDAKGSAKQKTSGEGARQERSMFVLHVGPSKTGTSYMQSVLATKSEELKQDHYKYIGNNHGILKYERFFECQKTLARTKRQSGLKHGSDCQLSQEFRTLLQESHAAGINLIGSNEFFQNLSEGEWKALRAALGEDWLLKVVISYRRLHEVVPSHYNQQYKVKRNEKTRRPIGKHKDWPGTNGDHAIPSFQEYFMERYVQDGHWQATLPTSRSYSTWADVADHISIFSIYQEGDMTANFVCQMMPGADHTCQHLLRVSQEPQTTTSGDNKNEALKENGSKELDYDMLSVAAYQRGWIDSSYRRDRVAMALADLHKRSQERGRFVPLEQECLKGPMLDILYEKSLEEERKWIVMSNRKTTDGQEAFTQDQLAAFDASWDKTVNAGKFCSLDADKTLKLPNKWERIIKQNYSGNSRSRIQREKTGTKL